MATIKNTSRGAFDLRWEEGNVHERCIVPAATFESDHGPMVSPGTAEISDLLIEKQGAFIAAYSALSIERAPVAEDSKSDPESTDAAPRDKRRK